jgi:hypothetical protein
MAMDIEIHKVVTRMPTMQMDIEGWEWDVLASLGTQHGDEWADALPDQLAIEFHVAQGGMYLGSPSNRNPSDFNKWVKLNIGLRSLIVQVDRLPASLGSYCFSAQNDQKTAFVAHL